QGVQILHYEDFGEDASEPWHERGASGDASADPLSRMLASDLRAALIQAIDDLPEREKLLLSLCYEQGLNLKEIGAVMGVTEGRVCQLRSQATARIRARLHAGAWRDATEAQLAQLI